MSEIVKKAAKDPIDLKNKGDIHRLLSAAGEKHQSLHGFEEGYSDIVDYIVRITHRIWEEADLGYIYDTYQHDCTVHTAYGISHGVEEVMSSSVALLAGFPDRRLYAEDVIWSGNDEDGFHTSHLIVNTATNLGFSPWGPPTGKGVRYLAIANCFVRGNRISEEWLVRDTAAVVRQLGFDLAEVIRRIARPSPAPTVGETDRLRGQLPPEPYHPHHQGEHIEDFVRSLFHEVWNGRHFNRINETHVPEVSMWIPNHAHIQGPNHVRTYLMGLIAMFPDAHLNVEHLMWLEDGAGYRVAVRWRFTGTHQCYGWYGPATDKRVNLLGISHLHIADGKVRKHYLVFDEVALLAQLAS